MKTSYIYRFFGILIFLQNLYAPLFSDLIVTKDGSRIKGDLILFEDGNLTFQTKFAGKIRSQPMKLIPCKQTLLFQ